MKKQSKVSLASRFLCLSPPKLRLYRFQSCRQVSVSKCFCRALAGTSVRV